MPKKVSTEPPAQITNAEERGQMLRHLISRTGKTVPIFAQEIGMNRSTLSALLNGQNDPETAQPRTAQRILLALGMRDSDVADALKLSEQARQAWRTDRPHPYGTGPAPSHRRIGELRLVAPMMGEVVLPTGAVIRVDQANLNHGIQVVRLSSGQLFAMQAGAAAQAAGEPMGQLVSADFSAVLPAPEPS